jgi:membrane-bound lytic murein transglycosylase B
MTGGASAPSSSLAPSSASAPSLAGATAKAEKRPDALVKAVQEKLNALGYDAGTADGELGPNTTASVKRFQEAAGLQSNGKIDSALLEKLYAADKGTLRLDHGIAMGASGLPNAFLSRLTKSQIAKLNIIVGVALSDHSDASSPFPFILASDGNLAGKITLTGSPTDRCRTYELAATLPSGASGKSARPQSACKVGSAWKLSS